MLNSLEWLKVHSKLAKTAPFDQWWFYVAQRGIQSSRSHKLDVSNAWMLLEIGITLLNLLQHEKSVTHCLRIRRFPNDGLYHFSLFQVANFRRVGLSNLKLQLQVYLIYIAIDLRRKSFYSELSKKLKKFTSVKIQRLYLRDGEASRKKKQRIRWKF